MNEIKFFIIDNARRKVSLKELDDARKTLQAQPFFQMNRNAGQALEDQAVLLVAQRKINAEWRQELKGNEKLFFDSPLEKKKAEKIHREEVLQLRDALIFGEN